MPCIRKHMWICIYMYVPILIISYKSWRNVCGSGSRENFREGKKYNQHLGGGMYHESYSKRQI